MDLRHNRLAGQEGSGLLLAMFVVVLLSAVGVVLLSVMDTELRTNQVDQRSKKSFYLSEAGLNHGREVLRAKHATSGSQFLTNELKEAAGNDPSNPTIDFDPATVRPEYDDAGRFVRLTGYNDDIPLVDKQPVGEGWYYSFLINDENEGVTTTVDGNMRVKVVGVGVGPNRSFEIVEGLVDTNPMIPADLPATILLLGPSPNFDGGTSSPKLFTGDDCGDWHNMGDPSFPVIGVIGDSAEDEVQDAVPDSNEKKGIGYTWHDTEDLPADTGDESVVNVEEVEGIEDLNDCVKLKKLAEYVKNSADILGNSSTSSDLLGTRTDPKIVYIEGDYTLNSDGNVDRGGILWITGKLTLKGSPSWFGPIFVVGEGSFENNGSGNNMIAGASVVANITGDDGVYGTADDCAGPDNRPGTADDSEITGEATWLVTGHGSGTTQYCSEYINDALAQFPIRPLAFRQR